MARKLRVQYPGAIYHVMNRGDHSESIFRDTHDPELFLATLSEACAKTDWQVHSFCLMSNHFHLVVEWPCSVSVLCQSNIMSYLGAVALALPIYSEPARTHKAGKPNYPACPSSSTLSDPYQVSGLQARAPSISSHRKSPPTNLPGSFPPNPLA